MIALGRSYSRSNKKPRSKIDIPSIKERMTEGQGSIRSGAGDCSAFCIVREHKNQWRNCIYHDIIGVFDESETLKFKEEAK